MKITGVKSYFDQKRLVHTVRLDTDEGIFGCGECSPMDVKGTAHIVHDIFAQRLIGADPLNILSFEETLVKKNYKINGQLLGMAYSGIDMALWDIAGKYYKQPVHILLGGRVRDEIQYYGSSMSRNLSPEQEAEKVLKAVEEYGFKGVKIKVGPRMGNVTGAPDYAKDVATVRAVRKALGSEIMIILDGNSSFRPHEAEKLCSLLEEFDISIFEEPCPYYDLHAYRLLSGKLNIPLSVGEQEFNIHTMKDFIAGDTCGVYGADVTKCGGFTNARRVGELCSAFGVAFAPHNTSKGIGLIATNQLVLHSDAANFFQEYSIEEPAGRERYILNKPVIRDGKFSPPLLNGIGAELDWELMEKELTIICNA